MAEQRYTVDDVTMGRQISYRIFGMFADHRLLRLLFVN